eukprot:948757_1
MTIHDSFTSLSFSSSFLSSFSSIYDLRDSLEVAKRKGKKVHDTLQDEKDKEAKLKQRRRGVRRGPQPAVSSSFTFDFEDIHSNSVIDIPTKTYDGPSSANEATTADGGAAKKSRRQ